jgi:hypothetical protein
MGKIVQWMLVIGLAFAPVLSAAPAAATLLHTWVASTGNDGNDCDISTPCSTFSGAYEKTTAGGEITCADSGEFAGLSITHSITVNCENSNGSTLNPNNDQIFIVPNNDTAVVVLRGLDFDLATSQCSSASAIIFRGVGALHVEKVKINQGGAGCTGISFTPNGPAKLFISDSDITNIGGSGTDAGVYVGPASGVEADLVIDRTHIEGNYFGIIADGNPGGIVHGVIRDSVVSGNSENAITASTTSSNVVLFVDNTAVSGNLHGLVAGGSTAAMMVSNTGVSGNSVGLFAVNGGQLFSYGNNRVDGNNGSNGAFTGPATLK